MKMLRWMVVLAAVASASACNDDDDVAAGPGTTTQIARAEIAQNTSETSEPIQINDLPISDADTSETGLPSGI